MQHHPDRNPGDKDGEHQFKEINEAYDVLKDPQKRAAYDRFGHAAFEHGRGGRRRLRRPTSPRPSPTSSTTSSAMGRRGAAGAAPGASAAPTCATTWRSRLEEAFAGKTAEIRVPTSVTCEACSGSGAKAGTQPRDLPDLRRPGPRAAAQGFFTIERTCPTCQGRGQVIEDPCASCAGAGRVTRERTLSVEHPGRRRGRHAHPPRRRGRGGRARRTARRPLHLPLARSRISSSSATAPICSAAFPSRWSTAALGGEFDVPTIDGGKTKVKVPEGTQSGRRFRLNGKGMPVLRSKQTGDMYVQVMVETPQNLTKRQKELLAEFEKHSSRDTSPDSTGFFARVKDFFDTLGNRAGSA